MSGSILLFSHSPYTTGSKFLGKNLDLTRVLSSERFHNILKELIRVNKVDVMCLAEPRTSGDRAKRVVSNFGLTNLVRV